MPAHQAQPGEVRKCNMCGRWVRQAPLDLPAALPVLVFMCPRCDLAPGPTTPAREVT